jgi:hypothetical protein
MNNHLKFIHICFHIHYIGLLYDIPEINQQKQMQTFNVLVLDKLKLWLRLVIWISSSNHILNVLKSIKYYNVIDLYAIVNK